MPKPHAHKRSKVKDKCVVYVRTSSAANVGDEKDSEHRQISRCQAYATSKRWAVKQVFRDPAVSVPQHAEHMVTDKTQLDTCCLYMLRSWNSLRLEPRSGADPLIARDGFAKLVQFCLQERVLTILCENGDRFARDLVVQETGLQWLSKVVAVDMDSSRLPCQIVFCLCNQQLVIISSHDAVADCPMHVWMFILSSFLSRVQSMNNAEKTKM
jgi:DNA invertase Pin-like site-specific DNA recombinase